MALTNCPECRAKVSDQATSCPKCGYPLAGVIPKSTGFAEKRGSSFSITTVVWVSLLVGMIFGGVMWYFQRSEEPKPSNGEVRAVSDAKPKPQKVTLEKGKCGIKENRYFEHRFQMTRKGRIYYVVELLSGPGIDLFVFTETDFEKYVGGDWVSSGVEPVRASLITYKHNTGSLFLREEGRYVIILDNTKYGQTAPPDDQKEDVAEIEYSISRKYYD